MVLGCDIFSERDTMGALAAFVCCALRAGGAFVGVTPAHRLGLPVFLAEARRRGLAVVEEALDAALVDEPDGGDATGERHLLANCPQRLVWVEREGSALGERQAHAYACRAATHVSRKRSLP